MELSEIENILKEALDLHEVHVKGEGSHFNIIAVSDAFNEMSRVKRQQAVYAPLADKIADGSERLGARASISYSSIIGDIRG